MTQINLSKILFLDIETVPQTADWNQVDPGLQELWEKKTSYRTQELELSAAEYYHTHAGIWAEFGKIVCISCAIITGDNRFRIKSFSGDDETALLQEFAEMLNDNFSGSQHRLCAHNGKEFDFPYLARRMTILGIELPNILRFHGKKPWEVPHYDTLELWKFGDYKHYTSLDLLARILGIDSPKTDIDGSMVAKVYYEDKDLIRIQKYCELDVITTAKVFCRMMQIPVPEHE
ncbi:MAG: 3'-5' exonuclease [Weeksellaceae bacterium]|nr:3'-5' exonuclease [Weeksellaceae bacterium]